MWEKHINLNLLAQQRHGDNAHIVAKLSELGFSPIFHTEVKGLFSDIVVQLLDSVVISQQIQTLAVRLPQKLHPRSENRSIRSILRIFRRYSSEQKTI